MIASLPPEQRRQLEPMQSVAMVSQGIENPQFCAAASATLRPTQEVVGVIVHGQPRAYPLREMSGIKEHVVNDYVVDSNGKPRAFTVTYCDLTECIRVFESATDEPAESLEMGTVGLNDGGLALFLGDQRFKQADEMAQLRDVSFQRTTWEQWKADHPETLVYLGIRKHSSLSKDTIQTP